MATLRANCRPEALLVLGWLLRGVFQLSATAQCVFAAKWREGAGDLTGNTHTYEMRGNPERYCHRHREPSRMPCGNTARERPRVPFNIVLEKPGRNTTRDCTRRGFSVTKPHIIPLHKLLNRVQLREGLRHCYTITVITSYYH